MVELGGYDGNRVHKGAICAVIYRQSTCSTTVALQLESSAKKKTFACELT